MAQVIGFLGYLEIGNQFMFGSNGGLYIVADLEMVIVGHQSGIGIGSRDFIFQLSLSLPWYC